MLASQHWCLPAVDTKQLICCAVQVAGPGKGHARLDRNPTVKQTKDAFSEETDSFAV